MDDIKQQIIKIAQKMYKDKLVAGTSGNISIYNQDSNLMFITPSNIDYSVMRSEDIVCLTLDGKIKESISGYKPSSEWRMHAEIYRDKPEVKSVIHTHSQNATAFAVVHQDIPIILVEMVPFCGGEIGRAKFSLPGTVELGKEAVKALENRYVCLLENHGVVAIGNSVNQAYLRAVYAEDAATIYMKALQCGRPHELSKNVQDILINKYISK